MNNFPKGNSGYGNNGHAKLTQTGALGSQNLSPQVNFMPNVREINQLKTASQLQNYASSKQMSEQGRTEMRGNVIGYSDTLG